MVVSENQKCFGSEMCGPKVGSVSKWMAVRGLECRDLVETLSAPIWGQMSLIAVRPLAHVASSVGY